MSIEGKEAEKKEQPKPLSEFLLDEAHSRALGGLLARTNDARDVGLAKRLVEHQLTSNDLQDLGTRWHAPLQQLFAQTEKVKSTMTGDFLGRLGQVQKGFGEYLLKVGGPDKLAKTYQDTALHVAVNNPGLFARISGALSVYDKHAKVRGKALAAVKKYGFDQKKYESILAIPDPHTRSAAIQEAVSSRLTGFEKFLHYVTFSGYGYAKGRTLRNSMKKERAAIEDVEAMLIGTLSSDDELRSAFGRIALDKVPQLAPQVMSFKELQEFSISDHEIVRSWFKDYARSMEFSQPSTPPERKIELRNEFLQAWKDDKKRELAAKGGLFAAVAAMRVDEYEFDLNSLVERKSAQTGSQPAKKGYRSRGNR
jgi:hypothetical protein